MPLPSQAEGGGITVLIVCSSVHCLFVRLSHEHDILKTTELILMPVGKSGARGRSMKRSTLGVRRSKVKVTCSQR